jgi:hypothetical protein
VHYVTTTTSMYSVTFLLLILFGAAAGAASPTLAVPQISVERGRLAIDGTLFDDEYASFDVAARPLSYDQGSNSPRLPHYNPRGRNDFDDDTAAEIAAGSSQARKRATSRKERLTAQLKASQEAGTSGEHDTTVNTNIKNNRKLLNDDQEVSSSTSSSLPDDNGRSAMIASATSTAKNELEKMMMHLDEMKAARRDEIRGTMNASIIDYRGERTLAGTVAVEEKIEEGDENKMKRYSLRGSGREKGLLTSDEN